MTEAEIAQMIVANRHAFIAWLQTSDGMTLAVFFLAYVIRNTPVFVRAALFVVFLISTLNLFMVMNIVNGGFLQMVQDLAAVSPQMSFSQNVIELIGATPTQAGSLPVWVRIGAPLIFLLNLAIGFHLLLLEKWER